MLRAGIVGLPNVGKSTLFNALTKTRKAEAANYPFCTIEPNVGIVTVPDARLEPLARIAKTPVKIPATFEFVDIAGLVKGASKGEGLGNKFLSHIREVDAVVQVVRCFEDKDVVHVSDTLDPVADIETIATELVLADLESVGKQKERLEKLARGGQKEAKAQLAVAEKLLAHLDAGKPALTLDLDGGREGGRARLLPPHDEAHALRLQRRRGGPRARRRPAARPARARVGGRAQRLGGGRDLREDRGGARRALAGGREGVPRVARRRRVRRRPAHPRRVPPPRPQDVLHGRREGSARLDDPRGRHGPAGGRRHPLGLREGLHQGRDDRLRRPREARLRWRPPARRASSGRKGATTSSKDGDVMLFKFNV